MQKSVRIAFCAGAAWVAVTGIAAGDGNLNCDAYAAAAVAHQQQNRQLGCGYKGGAWSADFKGHRAWCLQANVKMANLTEEDSGRGGAIGICRAKSNACDNYASVAVLQNRFRNASKCGFAGRRWSPDIAGHRSWCMSVSPAKTTTEMDLRSSLLKICQAKRKLANADLQNMLQKQQQTMQMLSNVVKQLHEASQSVIRKIGG